MVNDTLVCLMASMNATVDEEGNITCNQCNRPNECCECEEIFSLKNYRSTKINIDR
jgi:hypothetical protein